MAEGNTDDIIKKLIEQNNALMDILRTQSQNETTPIPQNKSVNVQFEKYDESSESWDSYIDRFTAFLDVQNISNEKRGKVFISCLSPKLFSLLKSLIAPAKPADKSFDELRTILSKHLNPKPLIIPARHAFLNRKQRENESIACFMAELRNLAVPCSYSDDVLNIMLRDVFVSGLRNSQILNRIFEEKDDIDLETTLNIALAIEKAFQGAKELIGNEKMISVNALKSKSFKEFQKKTKVVKTEECYRCGKNNHSSSNCKFKDSLCKYCFKKGHIQPVCFKFKRDNKKIPKGNKQINIAERDSADKKESLPFYTLQLKGDIQDNRSPILLEINIEGHPTKMELDTGAAISTMCIQNFRKISKKPLLPSNVILKSYTGNTITPLGKVEIEAKYQNQKKKVNLYILKENLDTIFGREWLYSFKIDCNFVKSIKSELVNTKCKNQLVPLLDKYKEIFNDEFGEIKGFECKLELKPKVKPVFIKARSVPFSLKSRVEDEIDRLEKQGIIEKIDTSEWATPVVPVVKKDGSIRLCADYSVTLNPNLIVQQHPLPRLEEVFASLNGGAQFSKIDFSRAYLQMKVHEDSQKLLTINTHKGLYACKRLMYGLNCAPAIWQKYVDNLFCGLDGIKAFMDDVRVTGPDDESHLSRLETFFHICKENGLKINLKKSEFFKDEINFLGHKINSFGIQKTDEKIKAIVDAPVPRNVQEVKSFLGLVNFYGKFCEKLSTLAYPLNNLTKKEVRWNWSRKCQAAFDAIKKEICSDRILMHYDPNLPLVLATDASPVGLGAVLSHRLPDGTERPISFASKTLTKTEMRYSQIDKEALGISWGVKKFYLYLKGRRFILVTDHKPLTQIFGSKKGLPVMSATRLLHYALHLQSFQFDIEYRNSKENSNADCLSRLTLKSEDLDVPDDVSIFQISQIETLPVTARSLAKATLHDENLNPLLQDLKLGANLKGKEPYTLESGCILYGQRVCIPKVFQKQILEELHAGHIGMVKMKAIARSFVYWENIDQDIERMVRNCVDCAKCHTNPSKSKVHYWEYPTKPWERIHIDFAGPFLDTMFLIIVDAHSKWIEVYTMKSTTSYKTIEVLSDCFSRYGLPITLVSDNGPQFTSNEFQTFMNSYGINHKTCAPFNPSSNGQAERYVFTLKQSLRSLRNFPGSLRQKLAIFLTQYRKAPNSTTGQSPSMLFLKREIRTRIDLVKPELKREIEEKQRKNNIYFRDRVFENGDKVAIRNYNAPNRKWVFGNVVARDGQLHYTILVDGILMRRHIDQIRPAGDFSSETQSYFPGLMFLPRNVEKEKVPSPPVTMADQSSTVTTPETSRGVTKECVPSAPVLPGQTTPATSPSVQAPVVIPKQHSTPLRRSSRIRRAPNRLDL